MAESTYTNRVDAVFQMFIDGTARESTKQNRLITLEAESGNTQLVGYGEKVLAEYDETEENVTIFLGHKQGAHTTVTRWLNSLAEVASERRSVTFSDESPWFQPPNAEAAQYIANYVSFDNDKSAVEQAAQKEVAESLKWLNQFL